MHCLLTPHKVVLIGTFPSPRTKNIIPSWFTVDKATIFSQFRTELSH